MKLNDPLRPKNGFGRLCLLNSNIVLTSIIVVPYYGEFKLSAVFPARDGDFISKIIDAPEDLNLFFSEFSDDPEETLKKYFGFEPNYPKKELEKKEDKISIKDIEF